MTRILMSVSEIKDELQKRINQIQEVIEDGKTVKVLGIQQLAQIDDNGCNWSSVVHLSNSQGYESDISRIVA
jgi:hypothetical protein